MRLLFDEPRIPQPRCYGVSQRRRAPTGCGWWEIQFLPLAGEKHLLGILGTIRVIEAPAKVPLPLPEKLMAIRDQQAARYRLDDLNIGSPALRRLAEQARLAAPCVC